MYEKETLRSDMTMKGDGLKRNRQSSFATFALLLCQSHVVSSTKIQTDVGVSSQLRKQNDNQILKMSVVENKLIEALEESSFALDSSDSVRLLWFGGGNKDKHDDGTEEGDDYYGYESSGHNKKKSSDNGHSTGTRTYGGSEDGYGSSKTKASSSTSSGYGGYSSNSKQKSNHKASQSSSSSSSYGYGGSSSGSSYSSSSGSSYSSSSYKKNKHDKDDSKSSWSWPWGKKEKESSSSLFGGGGSSYNSRYKHSKNKFKAPAVPLPWVLFLMFTFVPIGMLLTAHQFESYPEGQCTNFCRLSLTTLECIWKVIYNLYHCRLGDIPSVVCATDEEDEYTEDDLERMKLRPGIERALDIEHRKSLKKTTKELAGAKTKRKLKLAGMRVGTRITGEKNAVTTTHTIGRSAANAVGTVPKDSLM